MTSATWLLFVTTVVALIGLAGCRPPETEAVSVSDHPDALTNLGTDNLFVLTLSNASRAYALTDLQVAADLAGQTAMVMNFSLNDGNGNGQLDSEESLTCIRTGRERVRRHYRRESGQCGLLREVER
jgi:hypothetical protein